MRHQLFLIVGTLFLWVVPIHASDDVEKREINEVIDAIDDCYHWIGEDGEGDEQRSAQIAQETTRFCSKAQHKAEAIYNRYPNNPELAARILELIDIRYFTSSDEAKKTICGTAASYFKTEYLSVREQDVLFRSVCPNHAASIYGK